METVILILIGVGVFDAGILSRLLLGLLMLMVLAIPAVIAGYYRGIQALWQKVVGALSFGRAGLYHAPAHTWVKRRGSSVRVGLDRIAQRIVLGVEAVELPQPGRKLKQGELSSCIVCGDKSAFIASPVDGVVTAVNEALYRDPSILRGDSYREGWLFEMAPVSFSSKHLRHGRSARRWLGAEAARLRQFLERDLGVAAADGGELVLGTPTLLSYEVWSALTEGFLAHPGTVSTWKTEAARTDEREGEITLLRAIGVAVAGGLYIIAFPLIIYGAVIWTVSQRLAQLSRSGAARLIV